MKRIRASFFFIKNIKMFFRLCVHVKEHAKHMTSIRGFSELSLLIFVLYFIHLNRALRLLKIFKRSAEKMLTLFFFTFRG